MRRFAVRAFAMILMFTAVAIVHAAEDPDRMKDVSPTALLRADQFDKLEAYYAYYFKTYNPKVVNSYRKANDALNDITYAEDLLPHYDKWIAAKPDSYAALIMRGNFMVGHAWAARGSDWGYTIGEEGGRLFHERLLKADADLAKAAQLNPSLPFAYPNLITVDMALGRGLQVASTHFVAARQIDPGYYPAYSAFMYLNTPRWGGNAETMRIFAQNNADKVPGSRMPMLWVTYHEEMCAEINEGPAWWSKPGNWEQFESAIKKVIDQEQEEDKTWYRWKYVLMASNAGKVDVMRRELDLIGPYWYRGADAQYVFYYLHQAWPDINQYDWVIEKANAALKNDAQNGHLYRMRGVAELRKDQYEAAIKDLATALKLRPNETEPWKHLAKACLDTSRTQEALKAAERYLATNSTNMETITVKGRALSRLGRENEAIDFYKSTLKIHPSLANVGWELAVLLMKNKKYDEVIETVNTVGPYVDPEKDRQTAFVLILKRADAEFELKDPKAINDYAAALKLEDTYMEAEVGLGRIYMAGGEWAQYRERVKELVEENCKSKSQADRNMRMRTFELGSTDWKAATEKLLKESPNDPRIRREYAFVLEQSKRYAEAADVYKQLVAENPNSSEMLANLARNYYMAGKKQETLQCCLEFEKKFLNTAPDAEKKGILSLHVWTQEQLAPGSMKKGFAVGAPSNGAPRKAGPNLIFSPRVRELYTQRNRAGAIEECLQSLEINPDSMEAYCDLLFLAQYYQRQHIIDLVAKRNGPPPTAEQNQVFEQNKARADLHAKVSIQAASNFKDPNDRYTHSQAAQVMLFSSDKPNVAGAIKEIEEAGRLGLAPNQCQELMMYAREKNGELAESRRIAEELLKKNPKSSNARIQMMWLNRAGDSRK